MFATDELRKEHEAILTILGALEGHADALQSGKRVSGQTLGEIVDFLRTFADRSHHGKEEEYLFPALSAAGMPVQGGPIGVMLAEHDEGRGAIRAMVEALPHVEESAGASAFAEAAKFYCQLLRAHIDKENNILFMMAERLLPPEEQLRLKAAFAEIETDRLGARGEDFQVLVAEACHA